MGELTDLTVRHLGYAKKVPTAQRIYCSQSFQWHLFGRRLQEMATNPCPRRALQVLVDHTMPEYANLVGRRYSVFDVLKANHNVVDLAFMELQWRYAGLLGRVRHPAGLHEWPPRDASGDAAVSAASTSRGSRA